MIGKIEKEFKDAMKSQDKVKISALRMLRAAIKNREIEKRPDKINNQDIITVITKLVKQHKDSIEQFKKGNRGDLVEKETQQLNIIEKFLPEQLSEEEIKDKVKQVICELNAKTMKDMGQVMSKLMKELQGRADGKLVNELVSDILSNVNEND